jgi:hypothetical protein
MNMSDACDAENPMDWYIGCKASVKI